MLLTSRTCVRTLPLNTTYMPVFVQAALSWDLQDPFRPVKYTEYSALIKSGFAGGVRSPVSTEKWSKHLELICKDCTNPKQATIFYSSCQWWWILLYRFENFTVFLSKNIAVLCVYQSLIQDDIWTDIYIAHANSRRFQRLAR